MFQPSNSSLAERTRKNVINELNYRRNLTWRMSHSLNGVSNGLLITFNHSLVNVRCDFKVPSTFERLTRPRMGNAAVEGCGVVQVLGNGLFMCQKLPLVSSNDAAGRASRKLRSDSIFLLTHFVRASVSRKVHKRVRFGCALGTRSNRS